MRLKTIVKNTDILEIENVLAEIMATERVREVTTRFKDFDKFDIILTVKVWA